MVSGILGPRLISSGLLYKDHFAIYAQLGKGVLFAAIAFVLLAQRANHKLSLKAWHRFQAVWLILALLSFVAAFIGVSHLQNAHISHTYWLATTHATLLSSLIFGAGATFGPANLRLIAKTYKRELLLSLAAGIIFLLFLQLVYGLWKVLATVVLHSVRWLLSLVGIQSAVLPPRTLLMNKFGIDIAEYCSGIESIALFTGLYAIVGFLDWPRFNHRRFTILFPIGLLCLFGFNILRVFGLIVSGYYINPHIAFSLFHTYAGMVFFIIYSAIFWAIFYKRMLKPRN
jgi:exosortase/archaeosortase family protein